MLPTPSVARYQRKSRLNPPSPRRQLIETLTRRSRITNLGVFLLIAACVISVLLNLHHWASLHPGGDYALQHTTVHRPATRKDLKHLIMVPCHSIWKGTQSWLEEKDWTLETYQKGPGRVKAFYEHIARG